MSDKKPLAGEWWEKEGVRLLVVGTKRSGITVGEHECGSIDLFHHQHDWRHLPDCTGWDWQPEVFPQWYEPFYDGKYAYILRTSETKMKRVRLDGSEVETDWLEIDNARKRITQAEAESRIEKPQSVESPDDWVTQNRVGARPGIDERRFTVISTGLVQPWHEVKTSWSAGMMHGDERKGEKIEVRCRRRDLPSLPQETPSRNYVRLWTHRTSGTVCTATDERYLKYPDIWSELKHDGTGFYLAAD